MLLLYDLVNTENYPVGKPVSPTQVSELWVYQYLSRCSLELDILRQININGNLP